MKSGFRFSLTLVLACAALLAGRSAAAADSSTLHYRSLYDLQQAVIHLADLKRLRIDLQISSTDPGVSPGNIKLTLHRASGQTLDIPIDSSGHVKLPISDELKTEDPLIATNQPAHTLNATLSFDLVPLEMQEMSYSDLMLGASQLNTAMDREPVIAAKVKGKSTGLLLFYNNGNHTLTLHTGKKGTVIKGVPARSGKGPLKHMSLGQLRESTTVIFVKLDPKLLTSNPKVSLDAMPDQTLPAF